MSNALLEAAKDVLSFMNGRLPTLGCLFDNQKSRAALGRLLDEVQRIEGEESEVCADPLKAACGNLLNTAKDFFAVGNAHGQRGAVRWVQGDGGELVVFTRGEYRDALMQNIDSLWKDETIQFSTQAAPADGAQGVPVSDAKTAIEAFLSYGEEQYGKSHKGYFSGIGWAARTLRKHLVWLSHTSMTPGWLPSETAPKDGTRILLFFPKFGCGSGAHQEFGKWNSQPYNKRATPYWSGDGERVYGIQWYRAYQPSHWMPELPAPIAQEAGGSNAEG